MNYWLVKSEPNTYSWDDLEQDGNTVWDGVRNFKARNNLKAMKRSDKVLFYHSGDEKAIIGISKVVKEHYPDPTADDKRWLVVDLAPVQPLKRPVTLAEVKGNKKLSSMVLARQPRLSVQPVNEDEFELIIALSKK